MDSALQRLKTGHWKPNVSVHLSLQLLGFFFPQLLIVLYILSYVAQWFSGITLTFIGKQTTSSLSLFLVSRAKDTKISTRAPFTFFLTHTRSQSPLFLLIMRSRKRGAPLATFEKCQNTNLRYGSARGPLSIPREKQQSLYQNNVDPNFSILPKLGVISLQLN